MRGWPLRDAQAAACALVDYRYGTNPDIWTVGLRRQSHGERMATLEIGGAHVAER